MSIVIKLKTHILLAICLFTTVNIYAQQKQIYVSAFKYLKKQNKGYKLIAIDTLVHINMTDFYQELSVEWGKKENTTIRILDSIDNVHSNDTSKYMPLKYCGLKGRKPIRYAYFSKIMNNILIAEVLVGNKKENPGYKQQIKFNQGKKYLFIFNKNNKIKQVFKKIIQYD